MKEQITIQNLLRDGLMELQNKNSSYSLRSYANKLDINVGALSSIMNGKRNVSRDLAERLIRRLMLDPQRRSEILALWPLKRAYKKSEQKDSEHFGPRYLELEASQFKMIAEWEHYAVLSLMKCKDFQEEIAWIAERLGITEHRALEVIKRLLEVGLIKRNSEDKLVRTYADVRSSDDTANLSLRKSHEVTLDLAKESLNREKIHERDFTHITMAIDPKKISVAKEMIRKFQDELSDVMESGNQTEVYRFSTQLFPFSKINQSKSKMEN